MTALYRHYDAAGKLLYVGISEDAGQRLAAHMGVSDWSRQIASITIEHFPTRADALRAEAAAIKLERPTYNVINAVKPPSTALAAWLQDNGIRQRDFAEWVGIRTTDLCRFCKGHRLPSLDVALQIEQATDGDVPMSAWVDAPVAVEPFPLRSVAA